MRIGVTLSTVPPPIICAVAVFVGVIANIIWPLTTISTTRYMLGGFLVVASLLVMPGILVKFRRVKTPFDVRKDPSVLITSGVYKVSRNPSYVALLVLCIGIGIIMSNLWVLICLIPAAIVIERFVISEEEYRLNKAFGEEYRVYKSSVRRWL